MNNTNIKRHYYTYYSDRVGDTIRHAMLRYLCVSSNSLKLTVNPDDEHELSREFKPAIGSVYAYMLDKIQWNTAKKINRTQIVELHVDLHGV